MILTNALTSEGPVEHAPKKVNMKNLLSNILNTKEIDKFPF